jgi:hypothetical protein
MEKAGELLAEIKLMLERGDPECLKYIDALRGIPETGGHLVNEHLVNELIQQIGDFDFEQAIGTIDELMK